MQRRYIPATLLLMILLVLFACMGVKLRETAPTFSFAQKKEVYLTFDDGPSTVVTNRVLDILKKEEIKATFFIVSDRAKTRQETLKRIAAEGHAVGVHSASHDYGKIYASDEALLKDAEECAAFLEQTIGIKPTLYRFPGGGTDFERQAPLLRARGYRVVRWNAVCGDGENPRATHEELYREAVATSAGKSSVILLMHDSAANGNTAEMLPDIIAYYRDAGYAFCRF